MSKEGAHIHSNGWGILTTRRKRGWEKKVCSLSLNKIFHIAVLLRPRDKLYLVNSNLETKTFRFSYLLHWHVCKASFQGKKCTQHTHKADSIWRNYLDFGHKLFVCLCYAEFFSLKNFTLILQMTKLRFLEAKWLAKIQVKY